MPKLFTAFPLLIWLLAGCAELGELYSSATAPRPVSAPSRAASKPVPPPPSKPQQSEGEAPIPASFEPQQFIGREATELVAMLGEPEEISEAPPATIWRYQVVGCRMDVFLYRNVETRQLRSLSYKISGPAPACQAENDGSAGR